MMHGSINIRFTVTVLALNLTILKILRFRCMSDTWVMLIYISITQKWNVFEWYSHLCWIRIDQLDVTCFIISLFIAQHVSNVSTSIFRSLWLIADLFHVLCCSGSMCVGVTVWFGWGSVVSGCRLKILICMCVCGVSNGGVILAGENWITRWKTCHSATFTATELSWSDLGLNWAPTVKSRRLTVWAIARPKTKIHLKCNVRFRSYRAVNTVSVIKMSQLMLYREIIAVCSEIHTKHINTLCGQKVELLNVKLVVHIVTTGL